jgi:chromosome segregation ATPase
MLRHHNFTNCSLSHFLSKEINQTTMFLKLRIRRANKVAEKKESRKNMKLSKESPPEIQPVLTMTMSQDEEETSGETIARDVVAEQTTSQDLITERTVTFTEKQVMENALNQLRQLSEKQRQVSEKQQEILEVKGQLSEKEQLLSEKQQEILQVKGQLSEKQQEVLNMEGLLSEKQHEVLNMKATMEELKTGCQESLVDKDKELAEAKSEFEKVLSEKENEIVELKTELVETKEKLVEVSSVLIGCQHKLHEQSNSFWALTSRWI